MPVGILGSLIICTVLYIGVSAVATGIVYYKQLGVPDPIALAMDHTGLPVITWIVKFGALAGLTTAMLTLLFGQTRVFYAMAQDGLLPPIFARLHDRYRTPAVSQWLVGALTALTAGLLPIDILDEMVSIGTLAAFALVCFAVLHLRRHSPLIVRPFRAPGIPWLPDSRHFVLPRADGGAAGRDLAPPRRLDGDWAGYLLPLWREACPAVSFTPRQNASTASAPAPDNWTEPAAP